METPTEIIDQAETILELWKYKVLRYDGYLAFEDATLVGCVAAFETLTSLESNWEAIQNSFFSRFALDLRRSGEKSLNVNLLLLVVENGEDKLVRNLENDFVAARKIVRTGVTHTTVKESLLSLAEIQNKAPLQINDPLEVLRDELGFDDKQFEALLDEDDGRLLRLALEAWKWKG